MWLFLQHELKIHWQGPDLIPHCLYKFVSIKMKPNFSGQAYRFITNELLFQ